VCLGLWRERSCRAVTASARGIRYYGADVAEASSKTGKLVVLFGEAGSESKQTILGMSRIYIRNHECVLSSFSPTVSISPVTLLTQRSPCHSTKSIAARNHDLSLVLDDRSYENSI
jgi:hypothetical protein